MRSKVFFQKRGEHNDLEKHFSLFDTSSNQTTLGAPSGQELIDDITFKNSQ